LRSLTFRTEGHAARKALSGEVIDFLRGFRKGGVLASEEVCSADAGALRFGADRS